MSVYVCVCAYCGHRDAVDQLFAENSRSVRTKIDLLLHHRCARARDC